MSLSQNIANDMKEAMKAKNDATLSTLRLLRSALKNKEIDQQKELSDTEVLEVIKSQVKQLRDAISQFEAGGRMEMAESNKQELLVLQAYLPAELSDEALEEVVRTALTESGATSKADMGKAMGAVMKAVDGRADGSRVKKFIETMLGVMVFSVLVNTLFVGTAHAEIGMLTLPEIGSFSYLPYLETAIRLARVIFLFAGLSAVLELMRGGIMMVTSSSRDSDRAEAEGKILGGFMSSGIVVVFFAVTTVALQHLA